MRGTQTFGGGTQKLTLTLNDAFTTIDYNNCTIIDGLAVCAFRAQATSAIPNGYAIANLPNGYVALNQIAFGIDVSTSEWLISGNRRGFCFTTENMRYISTDTIAAGEWVHFYQVIPVKKV